MPLFLYGLGVEIRKTPRTRMATRVLRELTEGLLPEVTEQIP